MLDRILQLIDNCEVLLTLSAPCRPGSDEKGRYAMRRNENLKRRELTSKLKLKKGTSLPVTRRFDELMTASLCSSTSRGS